MAPTLDPASATAPPSRADRSVSALWLTATGSRTAIEPILLDMLEPSHPNEILREATLEELDRPVKLVAVALECLGMQQTGVDAKGEVPLVLVTPRPGRDPWREALCYPGGDCPIGLIVNTSDAGWVPFVHDVFSYLGEVQKDLVRRQAALAVAGLPHAAQVRALRAAMPNYDAVLAGARRQVQVLDPSVLFSPDGEIRVQLGSLSQTTRNLLREGLQGEHVFILPGNLFEGKTNYGDIEFLIYLNFFARQRVRTRIVGTGRQRETLEQLLTLTIFGLFDPADPEPRPFARLHRQYGVPDRATYDFFLAAYETYGVRTGPDLSSPVVGIRDYVNFIVLEGDDTPVPIGTGGEVWVSPRGRAFEVRIVGAGGQVTTKRLEVSAPRRIGVVIPEELREAIQFTTDRPRFGVTPLGTSHGFDPSGDLTSFVVWLNGRGILVDPSPEALAYLDRIGVAPVDIPYVFLTHVHADHDGGLIEKLLSGSRTTVIASDPVFRAFAEKTSLITGHDFEREGLVKHVTANPDIPIKIEIGGDTIELETRWNFHPIPTNGFRLTFGGKTFGYSGDTKYDPAMLDTLRREGRLSENHYHDLMHFFWDTAGAPTVDLLYHEAGVPPIHTEKGKLQTLTEEVKARTSLVHIADSDVPEGFLPGKPTLFRTQVLLPATAESRRRILLEAMRLVGYLYDIPLDTLDELLAHATVLDYKRNDVIIRKGPLERGERLYFYVIGDGEMAVKDGRRLIARLVKADSFGEWGISHQRGFRIADVVAARPSQCIRFSEAQYRWLVSRHPEIQNRISRIRGVLPRLQLAQERARLKVDPALSMTRSVIETMRSNQLVAFAIFSEVKGFRQGDPVIVEGDEADGFYVLLSGHLTVSVSGRTVGELTEGDVFGELGLLEGGKRGATITVLSADTEVLFMSTRNFQELLQSVPAFAWGIWETASRRRVARPSALDS
jgi:CRP-like cAMP-binding protein